MPPVAFAKIVADYWPLSPEVYYLASSGRYLQQQSALTLLKAALLAYGDDGLGGDCPSSLWATELRDNFAEMAVYKDFKTTNGLSALGLPSFTRACLLQRFEDGDGKFDQRQLFEFVRKYIPRRDSWLGITGKSYLFGKVSRFGCLPMAG